MKIAKPLTLFMAWSTLAGLSAAIMVFCGTLLYLSPKLPAVDKILDMELQVPLRIYTADKKLIAEFGEKKRSPVTYAQIPNNFINAILAAEDARYYSHHGVDIKGLARAFFELVTTGDIQTGGSTITMQVAKNYFLSRERTFSRKFNEILLALQLERELDKNKILELYVNKIYLGHRAYGIEAAANIYYGKSINELPLEQLAMIAGLPKAPSSFNPVTNPQRALERRNWILTRMRELGSITEDEYQQAKATPITASLKPAYTDVEAPYVAEMVRRDIYEKFGEEAYSKGYQVYTTIDSRLQTQANLALRKGLISYDQRHGYRGPSAKITLPQKPAPIDYRKALAPYRTIEPLQPALVLSSEKATSKAVLAAGTAIEIPLQNALWARKYISANSRGPEPDNMAKLLTPGDIIYVRKLEDKSWQLAQLPQAQSALISMKPQNGSILALTGGFDFQSSKFNRATQGGRQAGSSFKPFVYIAALESGLTPATLINDAPVVMEDAGMENVWRPENSSGKFYGPTRLRKALYRSRNLVSIRILRRIGPEKAIDVATRFGLPKENLPKSLSLALGTATVKPIELATAYSALANQGYKVNPWYIERLLDNENQLIFQAVPVTYCTDCTAATPALITHPHTKPEKLQPYDGVDSKPDAPPPATVLMGTHLGDAVPVPWAEQARTAAQPPKAKPILEKRVAFLINSMMRDVISRGTGVKAKALGRNDLAGKTGTTNEQKDAWFSGFTADIATTVWVGFDRPDTLGRREYGATAALPIWMEYMAEALKGLPEHELEEPEGIVRVKIDPATGKRAYQNQQDAIFEVFRAENAPAQLQTPNPIYPDQKDGFEALF